MNKSYINDLIKHKRVGLLIKLIKNNELNWSVDDYYYVFQKSSRIRNVCYFMFEFFKNNKVVDIYDSIYGRNIHQHYKYIKINPRKYSCGYLNQINTYHKDKVSYKYILSNKNIQKRHLPTSCINSEMNIMSNLDTSKIIQYNLIDFTKYMLEMKDIYPYINFKKVGNISIEMLDILRKNNIME